MSARILLVRDGDMPAATVERVLARDYAVVERAHGRSAAESALAASANGGAFDLAVVGDGGDSAGALEFLRTLRINPATEALPVIVATHMLTTETAAAAYAAGADAVIGPHPDTVLLGARLRYMLRQHGIVEELRLRHAARERLGLKTAAAEIEGVAVPRRLLLLTEDGRAPDALRAALAAAGFSVTIDIARPLGEVTSPEDAPELILIDMEHGDPLAVAARFRRIARGRPVAITHEARDPFRAVRALELGLAEPLPRPLDPDIAAAALARMAERHAFIAGLRRQYLESLDLAITDDLTGVFNRRYLETYFELQHRAQSGGLLSLLLLDVDRFKDINDRLGHAGGDAALRLIAERLLAHVRGSDLLVRVGGEEFVILMPGADRATAESVAERLRLVIAERAFRVGESDLHVTVSIGVADGVRGAPAQALMAEADTALYAAKRAGRNRVGIAGALHDAVPAPAA